MSSLPPPRRVITGHDANGKAIIASDSVLEPQEPILPAHTLEKAAELAEAKGVSPPALPDTRFTNLWRSQTIPAEVQGQWEECNGKTITLASNTGVTCRIVDIGPGATGPLHRTISLDFGVILKGEAVLELDDGTETVMKEGDVAVQRATYHGWHNRSTEPVRIMFVLVPAQKVRVEATGEEYGNWPPLEI
ncbi:MAG: hypothetical protein M1834_007560 [Cirrosporium novae-zelandiae]|nr:MAG: hypothetical protein M1834_007560 [Cirrosporium novae-zelandiae]